MTLRAVELIITPSPSQYEQLVRDLDALRAAGADSNTSAIVGAVRREADSLRLVDSRGRHEGDPVRGEVN